MKSFSFSLLILLCIGCSFKDQNTVRIFQEQDISIRALTIDTLIMEKDYFSGVGFFQVAKDQVFFVDQIFSTITAYDQDGSMLGSYLGKGQGPNNQNVIHGFLPFSLDRQHLILDNFQFVVFDDNFQKVDAYPIEWDYTESYEDMLSKPTAEMLGLYEIDWKLGGYYTPFILNEQANEILIPMTMSHPDLNGYISEEYYKTVYVFGKYDLKTKQIGKGMVTRSQVYLNQLFVPNFDFSFFCQNEDVLFVSYAIDPLIHAYDQDGNLLYKYGVEGKNVNVSYPKTKTIDDALDNYSSDLRKAGFYHFLHHDIQENITFRTYYPQGIDQGTARLQIYQNHVLIGDVEVPERFQVLGKIGDYYYADGLIDEEKDILGIFKFKL
ncbi:hypothetical protein CLV48_101910 [Cecembia rubra]|uniref:6-bladed beta-propeller protein n=2 Tax=Cecembia rubra TaxID=1485585 RepID=A0A2P8EER4_9BACT|nr:hypothetical protein CLV48_101910 [Cecembia rubra]